MNKNKIRKTIYNTIKKKIFEIKLTKRKIKKNKTKTLQKYNFKTTKKINKISYINYHIREYKQSIKPKNNHFQYHIP
ncbi:hypothetical protein, partial [Klebsiella pneumoniae]|uniref:hypothetical protein n=1 Tax=Klebsiella pneumoniae TaxID=573 RepID=UPI0039C40C58